MVGVTAIPVPISLPFGVAAAIGVIRRTPPLTQPITRKNRNRTLVGKVQQERQDTHKPTAQVFQKPERGMFLKIREEHWWTKC